MLYIGLYKDIGADGQCYVSGRDFHWPTTFFTYKWSQDMTSVIMTSRES